jgi:hypothetical protein
LLRLFTSRVDESARELEEFTDSSTLRYVSLFMGPTVGAALRERAFSRANELIGVEEASLPILRYDGTRNGEKEGAGSSTPMNVVVFLLTSSSWLGLNPKGLGFRKVSFRVVERCGVGDEGGT